MGAAVVTVLLVLFTIVSINRSDDDPDVTEVTLCDMDASGLCVVTFGANHLDRMVVNFQLPDADYPMFYVKASNRGIINVYSCEVIETASTSAYCTGIRTPLGESIDIEVYTTDGDVLIARGTFVVSAIVLSTPVSLSTLESKTETLTPLPAETEFTPTPDGDYSNP